jgi:hypothetical protein
MNNLLNYIRKRKVPLLISFLYVGLGTFTVCSVYGSDVFYGEWTTYTFLITFPVTIMSFGYRYVEPHNLFPVFIIQFIMFIITFFILSLFIKNKSGK